MAEPEYKGFLAGGGGSTHRAATDRGQAEVISVVLILLITIFSAVIVLEMGATALDDARLRSEEQSVEHGLKQLDSRVAMVALGDSTYQSVSLAQGSYRLEDDTGWIRVTHLNYSGDGSDQVIYNESMGALVYDGEQATVAYQGGGVWKSDGGSSVMVSPPEFHYRASTLTLPVIRVDGSGGVAGRPTAAVAAGPGVERIYPNQSDTYTGGSTAYANPVSTGNVTVEVHSEYYRAWADYFRTRSDGRVTVHHSNQTVSLLLLAPTTLGDFQMPGEGNTVPITQIDEEHALEEFTITLHQDPHFENLHWTFWAEENGMQLEIHVYSPAKCTGGSYGGEVDVSIYFYNGSGNEYEGWQNSSIDPDTSSAVDVDCAAGDMTIDLLGSTPLTYKAIDITGSDNKWYYGSEISNNDVAPTAVFDQHDVDDDGGRDGTYEAGDGETEELGFLVNHYLGRMGPTFKLTVADGPGGSSRVDESSSSGYLDYSRGGRKFVKYLHITENRVSIDLE